MATQAVNSTISVLNSWKEIASYLGRGVRTVQRYEDELRLPVLRVPGKSHGSVLAYKADLDSWLHNTSVRSSDPSRKVCNAPIISELHKSMSEHVNLRRESHSLRAAHNRSVLQLRTSLDRIMEQLRFRKPD